MCAYESIRCKSGIVENCLNIFFSNWRIYLANNMNKNNVSLGAPFKRAFLDFKIICYNEWKIVIFHLCETQNQIKYPNFLKQGSL